jgi:hypothetical protein
MNDFSRSPEALTERHEDEDHPLRLRYKSKKMHGWMAVIDFDLAEAN